VINIKGDTKLKEDIKFKKANAQDLNTMSLNLMSSLSFVSPLILITTVSLSISVDNESSCFCATDIDNETVVINIKGDTKLKEDIKFKKANAQDLNNVFFKFCVTFNINHDRLIIDIC
jgi:hypothetical protein